MFIESRRTDGIHRRESAGTRPVVLKIVPATGVRWKRSVEAIIRSRGATPATVAILAGRPHVGLMPGQLEALAEAGPRARKCSRRDLAVAMAQRADGATTVASTAFLASLAGIRVFVTGGMGGVHRGAEYTFDVSADLEELARTPIVVVCAGVKSILDIEKTLEVLETNGVPVVSFGTDVFPAFFSPSSGVRAPLRLDTPSEVAAAAKASFDLGMLNGMVVAIPNPSPLSEGEDVDAAIRLALEEATRRGLKGRDVTPFLLARVNETTGGQSLQSNVALVQHNAQVGADIAVELALASSEISNAPSLLSPCFPGSTPPPSETGHHRQPRPRVAIFGGAVADIVSKPRPGSALTPGTSNPGETRRSFGGVGRNVAEGLARLLQMPLVPPSEEGVERNEGKDRMGGDITLVSAVGADDAGRALVAACEKAGVSALGTVEVAPPADEDDRAGTASYVAVLSGDGDLVAAVADMRVMDRMTGDFVDRHAGVIDRAQIVVADGNLPPDGFARVARLCDRARLPLVFEPTSVTKCSVPFKAEAAGCIALATPNLDELAAMSLTAAGPDGARGPDGGIESGTAEGSVTRAGHSLQQAAIADGRIVDPRPLGPALKTVMAAMLGTDESLWHLSERGKGCSTVPVLLDGAKHIAVTMGSAGVLLASARPALSPLHQETTVGTETDTFFETPPDSGRWFSLSARHYPALPLEGQRGKDVVDCTGAGDCLVAGMVGGFGLGWGTHESLCLGLLCARQSVMAEQTVPKSLSELLSRGQAQSSNSSKCSATGSNISTSGSSGQVLPMQLPEGYEPTTVHPW